MNGSNKDAERSNAEIGDRDCLGGLFGRGEENVRGLLRDSVGGKLQGEPSRLGAHVENDENRFTVMRASAQIRQNVRVVPVQEHASFPTQSNFAAAKRKHPLVKR